MKFKNIIEKFIDSYDKIIQKKENKYKNFISPITLYLEKKSDIFINFFKKLSFKPNDITTLGILLNAFAIYNLINGEFWIFIVLAFMGFYCDILYTSYIDKFNIATKFSETYNILGQWLKLISISTSVYILFYHKITKGILIYLLIISLFTNLYYSIKQLLNEKEHKEVSLYFNLWIPLIKKYNIIELKNLLKKLRYFDENSTIIYYLLLIIFIYLT